MSDLEQKKKERSRSVKRRYEKNRVTIQLSFNTSSTEQSQLYEQILSASEKHELPVGVFVREYIKQMLVANNELEPLNTQKDSNEQQNQLQELLSQLKVIETELKYLSDEIMLSSKNKWFGKKKLDMKGLQQKVSQIEALLNEYID